MTNKDFLNQVASDIKEKYGSYREAFVRYMSLKDYEEEYLYVDRFAGGAAPTVKQLRKVVENTLKNTGFPPAKVNVLDFDRGFFYVRIFKN